MIRHAIIGASAAGVSAAETLRQHRPDDEIVMISDEKLVYSRPMLSYYLAGDADEDKALYRPRDFFTSNGIDARFTRVIEMEPDEGRVKLQGGDVVEYDKLLLATGASPRFPQTEGMDRPGVFGLRTLSDVEGISERLPKAKRAVVLGAGLVGLKAAAGLRKRGLDVTILVGSPHVLSQMLDHESSEVFRTLFEEHGVSIVTGVEPVAVHGNGAPTRVEVDSGDTFPCDLVVVGKGVDPNMELAIEAGLETDYGVCVNEHLETSAESIYAAGDVAQALDVVRGETWINALWPCAVEQGRLAALNMIGQPTDYEGSMRMNSVQFFDLPVISAGLAVLTPGPLGSRPGEHDETIEDHESSSVYRKVFLKDDTVVGFVLVGKIETAGLLRVLMEKRVDVSGVKEDLLSPRLDLGRVLPLAQARPDRFSEPEFQELVETVSVGVS